MAKSGASTQSSATESKHVKNSSHQQRPSLVADAVAKEAKIAAKALTASLKASRVFYISTASSTAIVSGLILSGAIQVLLQAVFNNFSDLTVTTVTNSTSQDVIYSYTTLTFGNQPAGLLFGENLYAVGLCQGLSLFFGNILMFMNNDNRTKFDQSVQHIWFISFVMMLLFAYGGIVLLLAIPIRYMIEKKSWVGVLLIPFTVLVAMITYLVFKKVTLTYRKVKTVSDS